MEVHLSVCAVGPVPAPQVAACYVHGNPFTSYMVRWVCTGRKRRGGVAAAGGAMENTSRLMYGSCVAAAAAAVCVRARPLRAGIWVDREREPGAN